jgi:hypothetical protein
MLLDACRGCLETALALVRSSQYGKKLNSAFIERLNAILRFAQDKLFRSRLAVLVRRSRALIRDPQNPGATDVPDGLRLQLLPRAQEPAFEAVGRQIWLSLGAMNPSHRRWSYRSYLDC